MEWVALIQMIIQMIMECRKNQDRETIERRLCKPGVREAVALRMALKRETSLRGRALHAEVQAAMDYLADMESNEVGAFLDTIPGMDAA